MPFAKRRAPMREESHRTALLMPGSPVGDAFNCHEHVLNRVDPGPVPLEQVEQMSPPSDGEHPDSPESACRRDIDKIDWL